MNLFDLHCDTAFEMFRRKAPFEFNDLAVSLDKYDVFDKKAQVFAVWCDKEKNDDECFREAIHVITHFKSELNQYPEKTKLCLDGNDLAEDTQRLKAILSVEDARLLGGDIDRLYRLYENGVRILTLGWEGSTNVCGGYDTDEGLTDFGFRVLSECEKIGITVDVSHLSEKSFWDVAGKAAKPFFASHSNSMSLCSHRRNLTDTQFRTIVGAGGVVGVSLVGKHLSLSLADGGNDEETSLEAVCAHIEHFLEIDEKHVCVGLDMDGTAPLCGLENVSLVTALEKALVNRGCNEETVNDVFYNNAFTFVQKALENNK